jgi:tRNA modification GTPase
VTLLTPPGTGAIATVRVAGPQAWNRVRELFSGKLPEQSEPGRFWRGKFAGDDVILAVKADGATEIHCHGGRRVVREVMNLASGGRQPPDSLDESRIRGLTPPARHFPTTLRTASILLDQFQGAFARAVDSLLESFDPVKLAALAAFAPVGRHLVEPFKVAVAGAPNVGKSSLVNALAGYQRSVVSAVPGTTRDVVTVQLAFDGWPVELADTAGLREAAGLEAEGIERAERYLSEADLVLWVLDGTQPEATASRGLVVINKCDLPAAWEPPADAIRVSAKTSEGIAGLAAAIARHLVPNPPPAGAAVPYTPELADLIERAARDNSIEALNQAAHSALGNPAFSRSS